MGPAIVNDFKSIEGDRTFGFQSFPVMYGIDGAKWMCAGFQTLTQLGVVAYLYSIGEPAYFQSTLLLPDPVANDMKYQVAVQPFLFFGLFVTALCVGHHDWGMIV